MIIVQIVILTSYYTSSSSLHPFPSPAQTLSLPKYLYGQLKQIYALKMHIHVLEHSYTMKIIAHTLSLLLQCWIMEFYFQASK